MMGNFSELRYKLLPTMGNSREGAVTQKKECPADGTLQAFAKYICYFFLATNM